MKYIVNFSGGLCSFWAAHRTIQSYGPLNTVLLFADTLIESKQLYEFNTRASDLLGVPITRVSREMTPWQLFRQEGLIANDRFPICSVMLKRDPLNEWMEGNFEMRHMQYNGLFETGCVVLGFDWTEEHRVKAFEKAHPDWMVSSPMCEEPLWDKCKMQSEASKLGLVISDNYKWGLPHDNCGGGCVRAGQAHWARLLEVNPNLYNDWENEEQFTLLYLKQRGIQPFTMMKETIKRKTSPLSLMELRERIQNGKKFDKYDWGGCGCGGSK